MCTSMRKRKTKIACLVPLDEIPFVDFPTIKFNKVESIEMPFRKCLF